VAYLFDTDAISELFKPRPSPAYLEWLAKVDREDQFTSAVAVGELYKGAFRSPARERHLRNIEERVLPTVTVLPFDLAVARVFGEVQADLEDRGTPLADADIQIAATALHFDLVLVTGNLRHFTRIPQLRVDEVLAKARGQEPEGAPGEEDAEV
jgi:predicted nucleic acid-binding protein